jgi:hypothetical protein
MDILPVLRRAILGRLDWRGISRVILAGNIDKVEGLRKLCVSVILPQMNPCSVENRTRTYQPARRISAHLEFDEQFESQLPPEVRVELETSPSPINRWSARIPETEEEIQQAIAWLKSQGYLPPTAPEPLQPPPTRPPVVQAPKPAPPERRSRSGGWGIVWMVIGGFFLWTLLHNQPSQPTASSRGQPAYTSSPPVEVRRALPVVEVRKALPAVPRALPVSSGVSTVSNAPWQPIRMPDGTIVNVSYQGQLPSSAALPPRGHFIGEAYATGNTSWVWMTPSGATFPSWVDP